MEERGWEARIRGALPSEQHHGSNHTGQAERDRTSPDDGAGSWLHGVRSGYGAGIDAWRMSATAPPRDPPSSHAWSPRTTSAASETGSGSLPAEIIRPLVGSSAVIDRP